ncbi:MAG: hypothetical protein ACKOFO_03720, partial [Gemmatimonadota bacterium]
ASGVDYRHYDPRRDLTPLLPAGTTVHHEALNKVSTYRQLKRLAAQGFDIFVTLCEGYPEWDVPGIDVIQSLEALGLPYTGPTPALYDVPKPIMKYVAHIMGVATPLHALLDAARLPADAAAARQVIGAATHRLRYPCFVKPAGAGDSLGVDDQAVVADLEALTAQVRKLAEEFPSLLVEEYIDGREFTVLVVGEADRPGRGTALVPVEYTFPAQINSPAVNRLVATTPYPAIASPRSAYAFSRRRCRAIPSAMIRSRNPACPIGSKRRIWSADPPYAPT